MRNSRGAIVLQWALYAFIVLNVVLLYLNWQDRRPAPHRIPPPEVRASKFIMEELDLRPDQRDQFHSFLEEHRFFMEGNRGKMTTLRRDFFQLVSIEADSVEIERQAQKIADQHIAVEKATFQIFLKLRAICDAEQKARLDGLMDEIIEKMRPHKPPHPPHGPGRNRPHHKP